jgi:tRNA A-37 threonylcarbamoyl transferase component Bud32
VRFVFTPPADQTAGLLTLPWREPIEEWKDERVVEIRQRGISRHVVRFVHEAGQVYALKEIDERLARREYRLLRRLRELEIPAVEVLGIVVDRPNDLDAVLVTKFLDHSISYRALFASPRGSGQPIDKLLDAMVELLARLHLANFFWGDCSLSNTLFRLDAGALAAYLVDAETSELHDKISDGKRAYDVELAFERVGGELYDLQAGGLLPPDVDPVAVAEDIPRRYEALWSELTREERVHPSEQRLRILERVRRLNELGFDVDEIELIDAGDGSNRLRLHTRVAEPGHHRRLLFARTGLEAQENQARRLLNDIASYRSHLERQAGRPIPEAVAANRWLAEVYDPAVSAIPEELRDKLDPVEVFHEILEHRWFLSERAGRDVGATAARDDYFKRILPRVPDDLTITAPHIHGNAPDSPATPDAPGPEPAPAPSPVTAAHTPPDPLAGGPWASPPGSHVPTQRTPAPGQTPPPQTPPGQSPSGQTPPPQTPPGQSPSGQSSPGQSPPAQSSPAQSSPAQSSPAQSERDGHPGQ